LDKLKIVDSFAQFKDKDFQIRNQRRDSIPEEIVKKR
jgi:hypothetical protein